MRYSAHHVAFSVNSLTTTLSWYQKIFGFEVAKTLTAKNDNVSMALIEVNKDFFIELFEVKNSSVPLSEAQKEVESDLKLNGIKHLCLSVNNIDDLITEMQTKGVLFKTKIDTAFFGGRYIFLSDPDGNLIELHGA